MNLNLRTIVLTTGAVALLALGWTGGLLYAQSHRLSGLRSGVMPWAEAKSHRDNWGEMRTYFTGETYGTTNMFTAIAVVKPGQAVHPAHRHAEEEFLVLTDGSGMWHLAGKEFPATKGDVMYVEPWVFHGLVNTSTVPLTFFVVRWNNLHVPPPPAPPGDNGH